MPKYYYFPEVPLEVVKLSGISMSDPRLKSEKWHKVKFEDWAITYHDDILHSIATKGQLNPNIGRWTGTEWAVEPGQARWQALYYLGVENQKLLIKAYEEDMKHFNLLAQYEHIEIFTRKEVEKYFLETKWEDHHGLGYLRRRGWFKGE